MNAQDADARQLNAFLQALRTPHSEDDCAACRTSLEAYVQQQLDGNDYGTLLPTVAGHLDSCTDCSEAYGHLYELMWAERAKALAPLAHIPQADFTFLAPPPPATTPSQILQKLHQLVTTTQKRLTLQFTAELLPLLAPQPGLAVTRMPADTDRYDELILQLAAAPDSGLPLALSAYRDSQREGHCLLEVTVALPGESWPDLNGRTITLTVGAISNTAVTDDWGVAYFTGVPVIELPSIVLDVQLEV